jgi:hypothetical protein
MKPDYQIRNAALSRYILLPLMLITVALLGGLRIGLEDSRFIFVSPSLISLILALFSLSLTWRSGLINVSSWLASDQPLPAIISNALTLFAFFCASAQEFNSVLPEQGFLHWLFGFFFLWTLWNNQFSVVDSRRAIQSTGVLFATAFFLKYVIFSSFYSGQQGVLRRLTGALLEGVSLGQSDLAAYGPATGYIAFFCLVLYVGSLVLIESSPTTTVLPTNLPVRIEHSTVLDSPATITGVEVSRPPDEE